MKNQSSRIEGGVKEKMKEAGHGGSIKELKDYTLIEGEPYRGCLRESYPGVSVRRKES